MQNPTNIQVMKEIEVVVLPALCSAIFDKIIKKRSLKFKILYHTPPNVHPSIYSMFRTRLFLLSEPRI